MNWLNNKYTNWYNRIIRNAQSRELDTYYEIHHIVPKSLGGTNQKSNLVKLTAKEHYVCHLLLMKMYSDKKAKQKMQKEAPRAMAAMVLVALVTAFVFETIFNNFDVTGVGAGIVVAFWIWLGFVVTTQILAVLFENQPWQVFWINTSWQFLSLMAMGAILGRW